MKLICSLLFAFECDAEVHISFCKWFLSFCVSYVKLCFCGIWYFKACFCHTQFCMAESAFDMHMASLCCYKGRWSVLLILVYIRWNWILYDCRWHALIKHPIDFLQTMNDEWPFLSLFKWDGLSNKISLSM